jgi:hypothetical protein
VIVETQHDEDALGSSVQSLQALKAEFQTGTAQLAVIGYHRQGDWYRLGSYGQWTASDAVVLYYDGIVSRGSDALYPVVDPASPFGFSFAKKYEGSSRLFPVVVVGGSYTFLNGSTASAEFLYNGEGYGKEDAAAYYRLRSEAAGHFFDAGPLSGLSRGILDQAMDRGSLFLRRAYALAQYQVREIRNVLDVIVRYTYGIEEGGGQASAIIEWQVTDRVQLFTIDTKSVGSANREFSSTVRESYIAGMELHY